MTDTQQETTNKFESLEQSLNDLRRENLRLQTLMTDQTTNILEAVDTRIAVASETQQKKLDTTLEQYIKKQEELKV